MLEIILQNTRGLLVQSVFRNPGKSQVREAAKIDAYILRMD